MKEKTSTVVIGLILFVLGGIVGLLLGGTLREVPVQPVGEIISIPEEIVRTAFEEKVRELEKSEVVLGFSLTLEGEVVEISRDFLTLSREGDLLTSKVSKDVTTFQLRLPDIPGDPLTTEAIEFEEIGRGDRVSVSAELTREGEVIVHNIVVLDF